MSTTMVYPPVNEAQMSPANTGYWTKVRGVRAELIRVLKMPPYDPTRPFATNMPWIYLMAFVDPNFTAVDLTSSEKRTARVIHMAMELAAQSIASGTHRLATEKEIEKDAEDRKEREELCRKTEEMNNPQKHATGALANVAQSLLKVAQSGGFPMRNDGDDDKPKGSGVRR